MTILKPPHEDSKGIIVFTHKERKFMVRGDVLDEIMRNIKENYFISMHWGYYQPKPIQRIPYVDFHFAREKTVKFDYDTIRIPLVAYNFNPSYFEPLDIPKKYDLLTISTPQYRKRLTDLLETIRSLFDDGIKIKVLIWVPRDRVLTGPNADHDFYTYYEKLFNQSEKKLVQIHSPVRFEETYPLPHTIMPYLYNSSRLFALFSDIEGDPRVINESLLCGVPVLARKGLLGSGLDYVNGSNSELFVDNSDAAAKIKYMLANIKGYEFDASKLRHELVADQSIYELVGKLRSIYEQFGCEFKGPLYTEKLSMALPSHTSRLPNTISKNTTDDLNNIYSFLRYCNMISDHDFSGYNVTDYWRVGFNHIMERPDRFLKDSTLSLLMRIENKTGINLSQVYDVVSK